MVGEQGGKAKSIKKYNEGRCGRWEFTTGGRGHVYSVRIVYKQNRSLKFDFSRVGPSMSGEVVKTDPVRPVKVSKIREGGEVWAVRPDLHGWREFTRLDHRHASQFLPLGVCWGILVNIFARRIQTPINPSCTRDQCAWMASIDCSGDRRKRLEQSGRQRVWLQYRTILFM